MLFPVAAEQKYDRGGRGEGGAGVRGSEAADYPCKALPYEGQKLGELKPPLASPAPPPLVVSYHLHEIQWNF